MALERPRASWLLPASLALRSPQRPWLLLASQAPGFTVSSQLVWLLAPRSSQLPWPWLLASPRFPRTMGDHGFIGPI